MNPEDRDCRIVVVGIRLSSGVAGQNDTAEFLRLQNSLVSREPCGLDHIAIGWRWVLLVLRGEDTAPDLPFGLFQILRANTIGLEKLSGRVVVDLAFGDDKVRRLGCYRGDDQVRPSTLDEPSREVVRVEPLHCDNHKALCRIVEPAHSSVAEPIVSAVKGNLRIGVISLDGIIDDQNVAATAGQNSAYGTRQSKAPTRGFELTLGALLWVKPGSGKDALVVGAFHERPTIAGKFVGEILGVARTDNT